jgi:hypothetical protein
MSNTDAADLRAQAARHDQDAADSFERCDTDGFLSQWASGMTARKLRAQADLAEQGGTIETQALFNLDGSVASVHYGHGEWGSYWVLNDISAARYGKRFVNPSRARRYATRERNMRRQGFTVGTVRVRGYVDICGSGTGLSGAASAYVATLPVVEDLKAGRYEVVSTTDGGDRTDY